MSLFHYRAVAAEQTENDTLRLIRGYDLTDSESEQARNYYHYVSDELGSTTHIFEGKECRNYYEYDAFGKTVVSEEEVGNRFKYTGQQHEPVTQQYYLRARYYNPVIARFTQEDPYKGAGLNLYAYCDNNPVIYFDPSGYSPCERKQELYNKYIEQGYTPQQAYDLSRAKDLMSWKEFESQNKDKYTGTGWQELMSEAYKKYKEDFSAYKPTDSKVNDRLTTA